MDGLRQDLAFAVRMLRKNPGTTAIAILALALGIGANSAIFSVVGALLLRPLPYPDAERLVRIYETNLIKGWDRNSVAPANFLDWQEANEVFESMAAFRWSSPALTGPGDAERLIGIEAGAGFFRTLGAPIALGRAFDAADAGDRVAVLGHAFWRSRFGGDPDIVGRTLRLDGESVAVLGVAGTGMTYPGDPDLWILSPRETPVSPGDEPRGQRAERFLAAIARLKPGTSIETARAGMEPITRRLAERYPGTNRNFGVSLVPLREDMIGDARQASLVLLAVVGGVLLIACVNVANLTLARATARVRELAVRSALGAGRGRLIRQLLTESLLLALLGGGAGLLLAWWGLDLLIASAPFDPSGLPAIRLDGTALGLTLLAALLAGLLFGLLPAWQAARGDLLAALKGGAREGTAGPRGRRLRHLLVAAEAAATVVLLIGSGLLLQSLVRLQAAETGVEPANVLTARLRLPATDYPEPRQQAAFYERLLERLAAVPGVEAAGAATGLPLGGSYVSRSFAIEGRPLPDGDPGFDAWYHIVSPDYFRAIGMPLLQGRAPAATDAAGVVVINDAMARRFWPGEDPLGRRISYSSTEPPDWLTIVGIVRGTITTAPGRPPEPAAYVPFLQTPNPGMVLVLRTGGAPRGLAPALRQAVRDLDPRIPVYRVATMEQVLSGTFAHRRFLTFLVSLFAALALLLSMIGVYGVMSFAVVQRTHEIGVRMALGALRGDVLALVLRQGMGVVLAGIVPGLAAAFGLTRLLGSLLYGVGAADPPTFVFAPLLLLAAAAAACIVPARRATRVDPIVALRCE
jgi:putative ABC transport system permease protein